MRQRIFSPLITNDTNIYKYVMIICGIVIFFFAGQVHAEETASSTEDITQKTTTTTDQIPDTNNQTPESTVTQVNHIIVDYLNEEIFNDDVNVTSTWFYDSAGGFYATSTISALGALADASRQGNFPLTIQGGWGYYVSDVGNHPAQGFDGWIYNINQQDPGWVGMNDYLIQPDDLLTVFYSVWPWKIESNTSSIYLDETVNFTASNYVNSAWQTSPSTTISINNQLFVTDNNGQYIYTPSATGTLSAFIFGSDSWPQNSPSINVEVRDIKATSTPETSASSTPSAAESTGSGSSSDNNQTNNSPQIPAVPNPEITGAATKILDYLKSQQDATGKIIDGGISDWAIMSFAGAGTYSDEIKNGGGSLLDYALDYNFSDPSDINLCAAYPRHILALLAGGLDKTNAKIIELKNKIKNQCFIGVNYGQNGINDDIFGLFALLATDEPIDATSTQSIINSIKSDQTSDGAFTWAGWAGADITGGAINALKYAEAKGASIEQEIYSKAKNYLKTNQLNDGGWGFEVSDALTTGWAAMGINALGETQNQWQTASGANPWHVLVNQLNDSGYYESAWVPGTADLFATKHAVPALLSKSWPVILTPKQDRQNTEPNEQNTSATKSAGAFQSTDIMIATTTLDTAVTTTSTILTISTTSTLEQATTSTPDRIQNADNMIQTTTTTTTQDTSNKTQTTTTTMSLPKTQNLKPKTSATDTNNLTIQQFNNDAVEQLNNETISPTPKNTLPINKTAKGVFAGATSMAGALGLYLAWRFIQTVV